MENLFSIEGLEKSIIRINGLNKDTEAKWGKMNVSQMLGHCSISYELVYESEKYKRPNAFARFFISLFAKKAVVGPDPYPKNGRTAPYFVVSDQRDFEKEKDRLIKFMMKTQALGQSYFDQKESFSFGKLSKEEWNTMFSKHIDHHLGQFGV